MMDFDKMIKQELSDSNSNNTNAERKHSMVLLNGKHDAFVRIVPLGPDKWFSHDYRQVYVNYVNKKGTSKNVPVFFPGPNDKSFNPQDDPLFKMIRKVISGNYNYRSKHPEFKGDLIKLQDSKYNANMQTRHEVIAIKVNSNGQMEKDSNGYPVFRGLSLPNSAFKLLLDKIANGNFKFNGKPFPNSLSFINSHVSYPIQFHFNGSGQGYDVQVRADLPIKEALPSDYLAMEGNNYVHMDNPELFTGYTRETSPSFYDMLLKQVTDSVKKQVEVLKEGNPYEKSSTSEDPQVEPQAEPDETPSPVPVSSPDLSPDPDDSILNGSSVETGSGSDDSLTDFPNANDGIDIDDSKSNSQHQPDPESKKEESATSDYSQQSDSGNEKSAEEILKDLGI